MAKMQKRREYRFEIDAFSPTSMPMSRLAEYISASRRYLATTIVFTFSRSPKEVRCQW